MNDYDDIDDKLIDSDIDSLTEDSDDIVVDSYGNIEKAGKALEEAFARVDEKRYERFVKEKEKKKTKYVNTMNMILSDKEISMHQVVFNEPGEKGMVKVSVREFINMTSDYSEKRDDVSRVILKAYYSDKDIMAALREYCGRVDIAKWIKSTVE